MIVPQVDGANLADLDLDPSTPNGIHEVPDGSILELTAARCDLHLLRIGETEYVMKLNEGVISFFLKNRRLVAMVEVSSKSEQRGDDDDDDDWEEEGV